MLDFLEQTDALLQLEFVFFLENKIAHSFTIVMRIVHYRLQR